MASFRTAQSALHSLVYVTVPNMNVAKEIAKYEWKGKLEEDDELLLVIKTKTSSIHKLKEAVLAKHPYETPEFIASPITDGSNAYLQWIDRQVQ